MLEGTTSAAPPQSGPINRNLSARSRTAITRYADLPEPSPSWADRGFPANSRGPLPGATASRAEFGMGPVPWQPRRPQPGAGRSARIEVRVRIGEQAALTARTAVQPASRHAC
jgi:hypothetical protein